MCDFSGRLVPWMDHELPEQEASALKQHLKVCAECRKCLAAYKQVDKDIRAYCDEATVSAERRGVPAWVPVVSLAAAAAVLFLVFPPASVAPRAVHVAAATPSAATVAPQPSISSSIPSAQSTKRTPRRRDTAPARTQSAHWVPAVPTIEIAIPAEAMLAPGAIPPGVTLTAEVSIAADGSAQQLRLQP
jgi:Putative zinc-finger